MFKLGSSGWHASEDCGKRGKKKSPESGDNELALGADLQLNQRNQ